MLVLGQLIEEQDGCLEWHFTDTAGVYSATNTGGYGTPNVASSAITSATLLVLPYGSTVGYTFTFTIASSVIANATVTDPAGTVTNILADLTYTAFPFATATPFIVIGEWMGNGADSELTASAYYFEYNVSDGTNTYTNSINQLITCQVCCCVRNSQSDLVATDCSCQEPKIETAMRATIFLESAIWAMENGEVDKSYTNLMMAKSLCEGSCTNC